jgi:hypothetical protein
MHSGNVKIANLVRETPTNKRKNQNEKLRVGAENRKEKREEEGADLLPPLKKVN